jgi:hypothetical protein
MALLVCLVAIGAYAADDNRRPVSRESIEYLQRLRKNTPFGANGFDLAALRAGMFHVFQSHEPLLPEGREAIDHAAEFMRSLLPRR